MSLKYATLVVYKRNCEDALRTKQCFNLPGKEDVNDTHMQHWHCLFIYYLVHKWLIFVFHFTLINACIWTCPVCMDCLELIYVKYFGILSKKRSNHLKANLSADLHLKWVHCWEIGKDTFSCITKALNLCAGSPLWGLCVQFETKSGLAAPL